MRRRDAKRWLAACLIAVPAIVAAQATTSHPRLTPDDIAAIPVIDAGAGTSGVSGIRTRVSQQSRS